MIVRDDWNHYTYVYGDDRTATIAFDVAAAVFSEDHFAHGVRVVTEGDLASIEAALDGADALLVGRLTYGDRRELVLQVADLASFAEARSRVEALGATVHDTPGWGYFDERVCPTPADWRRIQDRETLERLDLDGNGALRVLHRFFGDDAALDAIGSRLEAEGFAPVERSERRMALAHEHPLDDVSRITIGLMRLSEHHGAVYDGWVLPG
ncbi:MAG: hypothetical protein R3F61_08965 [Myxococcota bacterium]